MFDDENTQLYSGGQDTYIVIYDLVADAAQFKLMGHKEEVSQLCVFKMDNGKQPQTILVSASKDGFIKLWDLEQQYCVFTHSDALINKVSDFVLVPSLRLLVVANGASNSSDS